MLDTLKSQTVDFCMRLRETDRQSGEMQWSSDLASLDDGQGIETGCHALHMTLCLVTSFAKTNGEDSDAESIESLLVQTMTTTENIG